LAALERGDRLGSDGGPKRVGCEVGSTAEEDLGCAGVACAVDELADQAGGVKDPPVVQVDADLVDAERLAADWWAVEEVASAVALAVALEEVAAASDDPVPEARRGDPAEGV
jgi:hypothetical protein